MKEINEFEIWYKKLNTTKDEIKLLEFVWELMRTPYTEYHYSLIINRNASKQFRETLWSRFDEHIDSEAFLINKLENNSDIEFQGDILFCLGKIIDLRHGKQKKKVLEHVIRSTSSTNDIIRENAIIVLGWLGGSGEIKLLGDRLLNDSNSKCRAWASSSFMQIWFRKESKTFVEKVLPYLYKAIKQEQDFFVIESIINTLQEITRKKFGLLKKDLDTGNNGKIEQAKIKVGKYFEKLYKE
jgi:hypothetical protein